MSSCTCWTDICVPADSSPFVPQMEDGDETLYCCYIREWRDVTRREAADVLSALLPAASGVAQALAGIHEFQRCNQTTGS